MGLAPPLRAPRALLLVRIGIRAAVITVLLLLSPLSLPSHHTDSGGAGTIHPAGPEVERAMSRHDCRATGFSAHPEARTALVRTPAGELRVVNRQAGKAVYFGRRPGTLLAVCGL